MIEFAYWLTDKDTQPMKSQTGTLLLTVLITTVLAACESGDSGGDNGGNSNTVNIATLPVSNENAQPGMIVTGLNGVKAFNIDAPKLVSFYTFNRGDEAVGDGYISARMIDYGEGINMQDYINFYQPDVGVCDILLSDDDGTSNGNGSSGPTWFNVGDSLSINSAGSVWVSLENDGDASPSYETTDGLPGSIPVDATLNIPANDVFPSVSGYPVNKVAAPVRLSPDPVFWVTADSLFSWLPGNNENEIMNIDFNGFDSETGDYVEQIARCEVIDAGNFELPAELDQFLRSYGNLIDVFYYRSSTRLDLVNGVMFRQLNRVGE